MRRLIVRIIHPFHPLYGKAFRLIEVRILWGDLRVYFKHPKLGLISLLASWTDAGPGDPYVELAAGRCHFRPIDLLEVASLLATRKKKPSKRVGDR